MLLCCMIIGVRVYLEFQPGNSQGELLQPAQSFPDRLPDFTLNDVWEEPHSITEWAGEPMLINFWATWCAPCRREMPLLQALHNERATSGIQVIGIAIDRRNDVQSYIAEAGISYPILAGEMDAMAVSDQFGLDGLGLPFSVLVTADGRILTVFIGEIDMDELRELVAISTAVENQTLSLPQARRQLAALQLDDA
jgi:thiol-disulfide isomerase/thioredoxin